MTFAEKLKNLRKESEITQLSLATMIGVNLITIRNWENGICIPKNRKRYHDLAKVFGCNPDYFYLYTKNDIPIIENKKLNKLLLEIEDLFLNPDFTPDDMDIFLSKMWKIYLDSIHVLT